MKAKKILSKNQIEALLKVSIREKNIILKRLKDCIEDMKKDTNQSNQSLNKVLKIIKEMRAELKLELKDVKSLSELYYNPSQTNKDEN